MTTTMGAVLAALSGAIIGSFLNVVAYRLPRKERPAHPPSRWSSCGAPISWRSLAVEAGTALLCALVVVDKGADRDAWLGLALVVLLVPITLIDLDHRIIPNPLTLLGSIAAVILVVLTRGDDLAEHLLAGLAAGGFFLLAAIVYPAGMGMGDVKLAGMLGLFLGGAVGPSLFVALVAGSAVGALIIARKGATEGRKTAIPFGPYLALGGLAGLFAGDAVVDWYSKLFQLG